LALNDLRLDLNLALIAFCHESSIKSKLALNSALGTCEHVRSHTSDFAEAPWRHVHLSMKLSPHSSWAFYSL